MSKKKWFALVALITAVIGTIFYFTPHIAVYNMRKAIENKDMDAFSSYVNYPSLRESFKALLAAPMAAVMKDNSGNPFAFLGNAMASAMMNSMIEAYTTPESVSEMIKGIKPDSDKSRTGLTSKAEVKESDPEISMSYKDFNRFAVKLKDRDASEARVELIFKRDGLFSWKLAALNSPVLAKLLAESPPPPPRLNDGASTPYPRSSPTQQVPPQGVARAQTQLYPWDLIKDAEFKKAFLTMLGMEHQDKWLVELSGVSSFVETMKIGSEEYLTLHSCKAHSCNTENIVVIYSQSSRQAFAQLRKNDHYFILGSPPEIVRKKLRELYSEAYEA